MTFIPNTPESQLVRCDSKDPSTTCRGVTGSGRPCRRSIKSSPASSPAASPKKGRKTELFVLDPSNPDLYCSTHRDQAMSSARSSPGPETPKKQSSSGRASLDTLIDRLGIMEASQQKPKKTIKKRSNFFCCFTSPVIEEEDEEDVVPVRPQPVPLQNTPAKKRPTSPQSTKSNKSKKSQASNSAEHAALIPPTASPETTSKLMAELAKPISERDEAGYIYIFWLTPESKVAAPAEDAKSLLRPEAGKRSGSDVLNSVTSKTAAVNSDGNKTILLKIGRANNVQRRLNEWTRQCGYDISLVRYYPYIPTSQPSTPRKMPHSHKVERLIHLELAGAGLRVSDRGDKGNCESCGKSHKEWFEVEATREAVEMVDEVVRRWSDWDEQNN